MAGFVNPYNFFPLKKGLEERNRERDDVSVDNTIHDKKLTGKIVYTIKTRTPLFIPNTSNDRYFGITAEKEDADNYHSSYDFFSYTDLSGAKGKIDQPFHLPVIPGSEIRGAVRNLYEILTDSCMSSYNDIIFSKRISDRYQPGLLKKDSEGKWMLVEAYDYICRDSEDFSIQKYADIGNRDGRKVKFNFSDLNINRGKKAKPIVDISDEGDFEGYLIKGGDGPILGKNKASKCDKCPDRTKKKCKDSNYKKCYLLMKHNAHIFSEKKCQDYQFLQKKLNRVEGYFDINELDTILEIYRQNGKSDFVQYSRTWNQVKHSNTAAVIPVYYQVLDGYSKVLKICKGSASENQSDKRILLSPACITREIYLNGLKNALGQYYKSCSNKDRICPTCALFGMLHTDSSNETIPSRIRFSDLWAITDTAEDYYEKDLMTLEELGNPKPSTMEFYLKRPEVNLDDGEKLLVWTWDYYIKVNGKGKTTFVSYQSDISGRKIFWHSMNAAKNQRSYKSAMDAEKKWHEKHDKDRFITNRNKTIRPVKAGKKFRGELYFDGITEVELNRLIAILNVSSVVRDERGNGKYGLKIGGAKPLGLGSVEVCVEEVIERRIAIEGQTIKYEEVSRQERPQISNELNLFMEDVDKVLKILDFHAVDEDHYNIHYPYLDENKLITGEEEGFKWFGNNRTGFQYGKDQNKKTNTSVIDVNSENKGTVERKQVPYRTYMVPLQPELVENFPKRMRDDQHRGKIKFYNREKQFGFITLDSGGEIFFHISEFYDVEESELVQERVVEFNIAKNGEKLKAINCRLKNV